MNTKFIKIYDTNIRCSNIKQFGIAQDNEEFYKRKIAPIELIINKIFKRQEKARLYSYEELPEKPADFISVDTKYLANYDVVLVPYDYLYVTTYQGDNYSWRDTLDSLKKNLKLLEDSLN